MSILKEKLNFKLICCWLLLLQMVNLSINPIRHQSLINGKYTYLEDLRINKIESLYELILEHVFKKNVPETQDSGEQALLKVAVYYQQIPAYTCVLVANELPVVHNHAYYARLLDIPQKLTFPPPKAV